MTRHDEEEYTVRAQGRRARPPAREMATPYLSADERRAEGKALRDAVPRTSHAGWKAPKAAATRSSC